MTLKSVFRSARFVYFDGFGVVQSPVVDVRGIVNSTCFVCMGMDAYGGFLDCGPFELMRRSVGCMPLFSLLFCYCVEGI